MPSTQRPIGVLLANLGTPDRLPIGVIRRFLAAFLGDPRVIDMNRLLWLRILYGFVLTTRPTKAAAACRKIWFDEGSPLLVIARRQATALQQLLKTTLDAPAPAGAASAAIGARTRTRRFVHASPSRMNASCIHPL